MFREFWIKISEYKIIGLNITIGQSGDLNVLFKFSNADSLKNFEENYKNIISDLKQSFTFKENNFVGICAYSFEKEATVTVT